MLLFIFAFEIYFIYFCILVNLITVWDCWNRFWNLRRDFWGLFPQEKYLHLISLPSRRNNWDNVIFLPMGRHTYIEGVIKCAHTQHSHTLTDSVHTGSQKHKRTHWKNITRRQWDGLWLREVEEAINTYSVSIKVPIAAAQTQCQLCVVTKAMRWLLPIALKRQNHQSTLTPSPRIKKTGMKQKQKREERGTR